ncbi:MAG: FMN-binding protein [Clostridium sp.]
MKRKLLTTIILGITITSMFISCGDSTKDKDKKERKKVETSSISAEKSTKTQETCTATVENNKKETETAKNEENVSKENQTSEENNTTLENNEENKKVVVYNNEGTENNISSNNNVEGNTNISNSSSSEGNNNSSSEQKTPEQTETKKSVYKDGTYTGFGDGMNGKVKVSVTISQDKITSISVGENSEDEEYLAEAKGVIDRIIASQSTDVDVISGATYSSNGIIGGVNEALSKAKN